MKPAVLTPARIVAGAGGVPFSETHGDRYHPASGALAQALHVFLRGNGLPARWQGRRDFVVLETGFGLGNNFLATWQAWREDPQRSERLHFVSIEKHPPNRDDLARWHAQSALPALAAALIEAWPPLTRNVHRLVFDDARVQLSLAFGDVANCLRETIAAVDAYYLDGFAPARNPEMWQPGLYKAMARLAAPGATAATWSAARVVREGLGAAGFRVEAAAGQGGKRDITLACYAPSWTPRRAPQQQAGHDRHALIIGAGLAGCAAAWALAEQGWNSRVLDRCPGIAQGASGNAVGVFHGVVHASDGHHARFGRAAALQATHAVRAALEHHQARGSSAGLLRLDYGADAAVLLGIATSLGLPSDYVQVLDAAAASERAGVTLTAPAWFFPGGGWVEPRALARSFLERAAPLAEFRGGIDARALRRAAGGWQLLDACGAVLDEAPVVILANGDDALRLLDEPGWPLTLFRGQTSGVPLPALADMSTRTGRPLALPRLPITGRGYVLPPLDDRLWCGATSERENPGAAGSEAEPRLADHLHNLVRLGQLLGSEEAVAGIDALQLAGRVAWRCTAADRLPVIGGVPALDPLTAPSAPLRLDQPRLVPRFEGLYVFTALASRGISWAAIGARCLASTVSGAPMPLEANLVDAIDPARFVARAVRRSQAAADQAVPG
jgi:tRNA 5-methylaminomethyl-2-thiouridine biosynthesis bifunctional protein